MKFDSRKDLFFKILVFAVSGSFVTSVLFRLRTGLALFAWVWIDFFLLLASGFLLWVYIGTRYELSGNVLAYKSGPFRGHIPLPEIREIVRDRTLWNGLKPATARNGLIIKYGLYQELYISPKTNETFLREILRQNENIKVTAK